MMLSGDYLQDIIYSALTFSTGIAWMYWDKFRNKEQFDQYYFSNNNYGTRKPKELYVHRKYQTFKEEILEHIGADCYTVLMTKVNKYMEAGSKFIRTIKCTNFGE